MHSSLVRGQNIFGFFTTVLTVVACFIAATDFLHVRTPTASIAPTSIKVMHGRPHYYSSRKEEYASIQFRLDADLSSLFTWNTKAVFVYVTADWTAGNDTLDAEPENTAVLWDKMITTPSSDFLATVGPTAKRKLLKSSKGKTVDPSRGILHLKNQSPKYKITHPSGKLAETDRVRLRVHYNVQPWVGLLSWETSSLPGSSWLLPHRGTVGSPLWANVAGGESKPFTLPAVGASSGKKKPA